MTKKSRTSRMPYLLALFVGFTTMWVNSQTAQEIPDLPEPVSNTAVALLSSAEDTWLLSFMGLGEGKNWQAVHNRVWAPIPKLPQDTVSELSQRFQYKAHG